MSKKIELGDKVKDTVTGVVGIAVARTIWLHGCDRITVQPTKKKDNELPDTLAFDEPSLVIVEKQKVSVKPPKNDKEIGGPIRRSQVWGK